MLESYQPTSQEIEFDMRLAKALREPPIDGILAKNGQWTPIFIEGITMVEEACRERGICHHGFDHLNRVSKNVLMLKDITQQRSKVSISDSEILFPALVHDIGYGIDPDWQGLDAINHAKRGAQFLRLFRTIVLVGLPNVPTASLEILERSAQIYRFAIAADRKELIARTSESIELGKISLPTRIALIVNAADKFDRYHKARINELTPPETYEDNPYYFLSNMVSSYKLSYHNTLLSYHITLDTAQPIPTTTGMSKFDGQRWKEETCIEHDSFWTLAETFTNSVGIEFETVSSE